MQPRTPWLTDTRMTLRRDEAWRQEKEEVGRWREDFICSGGRASHDGGVTVKVPTVETHYWHPDARSSNLLSALGTPNAIRTVQH